MTLADRIVVLRARADRAGRHADRTVQTAWQPLRGRLHRLAPHERPPGPRVRPNVTQVAVGSETDDLRRHPLAHAASGPTRHTSGRDRETHRGRERDSGGEAISISGLDCRRSPSRWRNTAYGSGPVAPASALCARTDSPGTTGISARRAGASSARLLHLFDLWMEPGSPVAETC